MQYSKIATKVEIRYYNTSFVYICTTTIIYHVTSIDLETV